MGSWSLLAPDASDGRSRGSPFGLEPVLVDVGVQEVFGGTSVVLPEVGLSETDFVQGSFRQTRVAVGELFRIRERADQRLDPPDLPFEIRWGAYVARLLRRKHPDPFAGLRSEEHTSELQSHSDLVCRLLLEKKKKREELVTGVKLKIELAAKE